MMLRHRLSRNLLFALAGLLLSGTVSRLEAGVISVTDCLPPIEKSAYTAPYESYGLTYLLNNPLHSGFVSCLPPTVTGTQSHTFSSTVEGDLAAVGGPPLGHFMGAGNVTVNVTLDVLASFGRERVFNTEMLSLDISGNVPGLLIRESPTLQSLGQTKITDLGPGNGFQIDSFFDIFTELSLDGGANWIPSDQQNGAHMVLGPASEELPVPEPASLLLVGTGLLIGARQWRKRQAKS